MTRRDDCPTGEELVGELRQAAWRTGVGIHAFIAPLLTPGSSPGGWLAHLRRSVLPLPLTVERVRALIDGRPIPPSRPVPNRSRAHRITDGDGSAFLKREQVEFRQALAEAAHAGRLPGETLHAAIKRIAAMQPGAGISDSCSPANSFEGEM